MKKKIVALIISLTLLLTMVINIQAASGYQGYVVYRDGVLGSYQWHAAMMYKPYSTDYKPIMHHSGSGYAKIDTWNNFIDGNTYKGVYKHPSNPNSSTRDLFVAMEKKLADENIPYTYAYQVVYDWTTAGTWVNTDEIENIRCDGVVEYIHEWYGYRVYGNDTLWDVTKCNIDNMAHHHLIHIGPKGQSGYLTKISSGLPSD